MQWAFNISGVVMVLSGLGFAGSMALETLAGKPVFTVSGGEMTITASPIDRVLLGLFVVSALLTMAFWTGLKQKR